jgi:hypothetical protein
MLKIFVIIFLSLTLKNLNLNAEEEESDDEESCLEMRIWKEFKIELEIKFQDAESELNSYVLFIYLKYKFFFSFYLFVFLKYFNYFHSQLNTAV